MACTLLSFWCSVFYRFPSSIFYLLLSTFYLAAFRASRKRGYVRRRPSRRTEDEMADGSIYYHTQPTKQIPRHQDTKAPTDDDGVKRLVSRRNQNIPLAASWYRYYRPGDPKTGLDRRPSCSLCSFIRIKSIYLSIYTLPIRNCVSTSAPSCHSAGVSLDQGA